MMLGPFVIFLFDFLSGIFLNISSFSNKKYTMRPNEYMSVGYETSKPLSCSGDEYNGDPIFCVFVSVGIDLTVSVSEIYGK